MESIIDTYGKGAADDTQRHDDVLHVILTEDNPVKLANAIQSLRVLFDKHAYNIAEKENAE